MPRPIHQPDGESFDVTHLADIGRLPKCNAGSDCDLRANAVGVGQTNVLVLQQCYIPT